MQLSCLSASCRVLGCRLAARLLLAVVWLTVLRKRSLPERGRGRRVDELEALPCRPPTRGPTPTQPPEPLASNVADVSTKLSLAAGPLLLPVASGLPSFGTKLA